MQILVIGGGGREHALAWQAARSPQVQKVYVAPGNAGTALETKVVNVDIAADDLHSLLAFAIEKQIDLTLVGPEVPLVAGIVDIFYAADKPCFGPMQNAAILEGSKSFSKAFLERQHIPTAAYQSFTELAPALAYIAEAPLPIVIKADGLAAGKGVVIAHTHKEARAHIQQCLATDTGAGRIVIEDYLRGEELSFMVLTDGEHILPLASAQDHKARDAGDIGPNTGGMGAYSPAPIITPVLFERIMAQIIRPTVAGMAAEGRPYRGVLYAGLMINDAGQPYVLEFNCRLGDPEAQAVLMRLSSDLIELCEATLSGTLHKCQIDWDTRTSLCVVLASAGYPGPLTAGPQPISGLSASNVSGKIFHAATKRAAGDQIVTDGGRVLAVTALADTVALAQQSAYEQIQAIHWPGMFYRQDIGHRAISKP